MLTASELIAFERDIAEAFNRSEIRAPIHLSGNNEQPLIDYFTNNYNFNRGDWIFTNWRSHYHILLSGLDPQRLRTDILAGRSITLTYPDHRIVSSAIVGGALPIALGTALSIKRQGGAGRVHCFMGDMTARTGIFHECRDYACGWDLPITFVVEDNGKSVMTDTEAVWRASHDAMDDSIHFYYQSIQRGHMTEDLFKTVYYTYSLPWPHAGAGHRVQF